MAKRRSRKKTTRRKKQGVSILGVAETYMLLNVATQTVLGVTPWNFFTAGYMQGSGSGSGWQKSGDPHQKMITLKEMLQGSQAGSGVSIGDAIQSNIKNNWVKGVAGMVLIPMFFRLGKTVSRPAISRTNRLLNNVGRGKTVKV